MKHVKSIGLALLYLAITYGIFEAIKYIFYGSGVFQNSSFVIVYENNDHVPILIWFILAFLALFLVTKLIKKQNLITYSGFKKITSRETLIMMLIGFGAFWFNTLFINISVIDANFPQYDEFLTYNYENSHIVWGILASVLAGPIFEEFLFRSLIYKELRNAFPMIPAVIITSVLYGVMFFDIPLMLFCVVAGCLYSFIYINTNNLVYIIVVQLVATSGVLFSRRLGIESLLDKVGDGVIVPGFILSIAIVIFGCFLLVKELKSKKQSEELIETRNAV